MANSFDGKHKNRRNIKTNTPTRRRQRRVKGRAAKPMGRPNPAKRTVGKKPDRRVEEACARLSYLPALVAARFARRLPAHVELDDLVGAGSVGLVIAVRQHIDKPEADLARLAKQRIRGAILDHLRSVDHLTRRQRAAVTAFNHAQRNLICFGQNHDVDSVASRLGITVDRAQHIQTRLAAVQIGSLETAEQVSSGSPQPDQSAMGTEDGDRLRHAVKQLPQRLQTILSLYYRESLTYKEIGDRLRISRSRICQLHTQAIGELRRKMLPRAA